MITAWCVIIECENRKKGLAGDDLKYNRAALHCGKYLTIALFCAFLSFSALSCGGFGARAMIIISLGSLPRAS